MISGRIVCAVGSANVDDRCKFHVIGTEEVGQIQLGGRASLNANRRSIQLMRARYAQVLTNHKALAVVVIHAGKFEAQIHVA